MTDLIAAEMDPTERVRRDVDLLASFQRCTACQLRRSLRPRLQRFAAWTRSEAPANRDTVIGRATCDRRTIHVHDLAAQDSEYPVGSRDAKREGHRTTLATPLLREAARSRRSTRPSPPGWEWGCRSPVGSSRRTVDGYGPRPTRRAVLPFSSRCLRAGRARRDAAPLSPKRRVRFLRTMPPFPTPKFGRYWSKTDIGRRRPGR